MVTHESDTTRLEMFSDGVMAIAITLLALEIRIDRHAGESLGSAILHSWPLLLAYAISFLQIGIIWTNHHNRLRYFGRSDHTLLVLHILFLMGVAFIPVPTKTLGEHVLGSAEEFRSATAFYAATLAFTAIWFTALCMYGSRHLLREEIAPHLKTVMNRRYLAGALVYVAAFGLAFLSPIASLVLITVLALRFLIPEPTSVTPSQE